MKLGIMQPYFLPYVGYFQLIASVDQFIIYDNIKYTKKGWINRNRMLKNGSAAIFSLPIKKASDFVDVVEREISPEFNRIKLLNQFMNAYKRAPHFEQTYELIESIVLYNDSNLFSYIHNSILQLCKHLHITTEILISSEVAIDHTLKSEDKVLALCNATGADIYINSTGGTELYLRKNFNTQGIDLRFIQSKPFEYQQFDSIFIPCLSIIDVLMFNPLEATRQCIFKNYEFI